MDRQPTARPFFPAMLVHRTLRPDRMRRPIALTLALALAVFAASTGQCGELRTAERTLHTYAFGDREFTCLVLDGGQFPLAPPVGARFAGQDDGLTLLWPGTATARFRGASAAEAALVTDPRPAGMAPTTAETNAWWRVTAAGLAAGMDSQPGPHGVVTDALPVNGWRAGAADLTYESGGQRFGHLLLVCRTREGATFAVSLDAPAAEFDGCRESLLRLLGAAVWMSAP